MNAPHVALYCRVSSQGQKDNYSIPDQMRIGEQFLKRAGLPYTVFKEIKSASTVDAREKFVEILHGIESGLYGGIWVIHTDRLFRNAAEALSHRDYFLAKGTRVFVDQAELPLSSSTDFVTYGFQNVMNEYIRLQIKEKSRRGRHSQMDAGKSVYSRCYGYRFVFAPDGSKTIEVNEEQAKVVKLVFAEYLSSKSVRSVAETLYRFGYATSTGKLSWQRSQIFNMLKQPVYAGLSRNSRKELVESSLYPVLVDRADWNAVQKLLGEYGFRREVKAKSYLSKHFLSGVITCSECGGKYYYGVGGKDRIYMYHHGITTGKNISCSHANHGRKAEYIDALVVKSIALVLTNKTWLKYYQELQDAKNEALQGQISEGKKRLRDAIDDRNKQLERVKKAVLDGAEYSLFRDEVNAINAQIVELNASLHAMTIGGTSDNQGPENPLKAVNTFSQKIAELTEHERKAFVLQYLEGVESAHTTLTVKTKFGVSVVAPVEGFYSVFKRMAKAEQALGVQSSTASLSGVVALKVLRDSGAFVTDLGTFSYGDWQEDNMVDNAELKVKFYQSVLEAIQQS